VVGWGTNTFKHIAQMNIMILCLGVLVCLMFDVGTRAENQTFKKRAPGAIIECLFSVLFVFALELFVLFRFVWGMIGRGINTFQNVVPDEDVGFVLFEPFELFDFGAGRSGGKSNLQQIAPDEDVDRVSFLCCLLLRVSFCLCFAIFYLGGRAGN